MIHHVQLGASIESEDAARAFWVGVIGLTEIAKPAALAPRGGCWFRGLDVEIHVGIENDFRPATEAHPGIIVRNLDALARRLIAAGHSVARDDGLPGMRRFYSADPFGNRLEFLEPIRP